ncbi:MAG: HAMP domain-containing histidine kinase [Planctomycetes bacterium]|nr:HAMP domain-containing histidine kinase [Planctomycetota bacterium]
MNVGQPRIAMVSGEPGQLLTALHSLPSRPLVRAFADLFADGEAILHFQPRVLIHAQGEPGEAEIGALRLLRSLQPALSVVLVVAREREAVLKPMARQLGAALLLQPFAPEDVAEALGLVTHPLAAEAMEVLVEFARAISDEVNNPLLFVAGHLQLIQQGGGEGKVTDMQGRLRAMDSSLQRIHAAMEKVRTFTRAVCALGQGQRLGLAALLTEATRTVRARVGCEVALFLDPTATDAALRGDPELLGAALEHLLRCAIEIARQEPLRGLTARVEGDRVILHLELLAPAIADWQLPPTFEPHRLGRVLRNTSLGLGLLLVQTIVHAHGGEALARRRADRTVLLEIALPVAS